MDKLYASTDAVGVVSEVLLAVLNTNVFPLFLIPLDLPLRVWSHFLGKVWRI